VRAVHSVASAVKAVVGDGRSGDPLHERDDKRDVYEGEVAMVDSVSELVRRVDGVVDGLRSLVDVARGSVGGVCSNVFEEVEERFAHPSVRVHHERDELLMHRRSHSFVLVVLIGLANPEWVTVGDRVSLAGLRLACVVSCVAHDVGDGDVCEDCDAGVSQAVDSDVWAQVVGVAVPVRGAWYLADGLGERGQAALLADRLDGELYLVVRFVLVATCVAGMDADQVIESVTGFEGRVRRVAAVRETLVVVHVGEAWGGRVPVGCASCRGARRSGAAVRRGRRGAMSLREGSRGSAWRPMLRGMRLGRVPCTGARVPGVRACAAVLSQGNLWRFIIIMISYDII